MSTLDSELLAFSRNRKPRKYETRKLWSAVMNVKQQTANQVQALQVGNRPDEGLRDRIKHKAASGAPVGIGRHLEAYCCV